MGFSLNKVQLIGRLGKDPEIRYTQAGKAVANLSVATSESWKDQNGDRQERTEWHRVVAFGNLAEIIGKYLKKGDQAYFEGQIKTRKWTDDQDNDRYTTEIVISGFDGRMGMLGSPNGGQGNGGQQQGNQQQQNNQSQSGGGYQPQNQGFDDDIPF